MKVDVTRIDRPSVASLVRAAEEHASEDHVVLLLVGEQTGIDSRLLHERLSSTSAVFAGAIVPGVVFGKNVDRAAALVCRLPCGGEPCVVNPLSPHIDDLPVGILQWQEAVSSGEQLSLLVLVDGLAARIPEFLSALSGYLGPRGTYVGGGAASTDLVQRPCLFTRAGIFCDGAIVVPVRSSARCAVRHGWKPVGSPMMVTRSAGNVVFELNWREAFDVYRQALSELFGKQLTHENFASFSRQYPLGIVREHAEHLVRDPIAVGRDGSLVCVGDMPENAIVHMMEGCPESLIAAAEQVTREAVSELGARPCMLWITDCVSRREYLGPKFEDELAAIQKVALQSGVSGEPCGFLSFGEIATTASGALNFHNKTIVATVFYE